MLSFSSLNLTNPSGTIHIWSYEVGAHKSDVWDFGSQTVIKSFVQLQGVFNLWLMSLAVKRALV